MSSPVSKRTSLPTREALLAFIEESPGDVARREIARAFKVRGGDRARLKQMIKELEDDSLIARGRRRRLAASGRLPPVAVVEVTGLDAD
ncbi:MAG: ribonuclease R, partial [Proteobacteria bacterium]|nr:ribonuclease R [Pseudomonadota bacterium]